MESKKVIIDTFNPYESRFPDRKLITRDTLLLIKYLRVEGYEIIIEPRNDLPVELLYKKGVMEFFADPINVTLIGIPIAILTNIISNRIQKLLGKKKAINKSNINIRIDNSTHIYNYLGEHQDKNNRNHVEIKRNKLKDGFERCFEIRSPYEEYPVPIFLEHRPKIVGWCSLREDDKGLKSEGIIIDKTAKRRLSQNRLNGASVTGIATKTECSICKSNFVYCEHIAGTIYNEEKCFNRIIETDFVETSIVKEPINPECILGWQK
jgi:hypothetical protein